MFLPVCNHKQLTTLFSTRLPARLKGRGKTLKFELKKKLHWSYSEIITLMTLILHTAASCHESKTQRSDLSSAHISVQILTCWEVENNLGKTVFKYIFMKDNLLFSEWITELITYMDDQHHDVWVSLRAVWNMTSCIFWNINMHTDHYFIKL